MAGEEHKSLILTSLAVAGDPAALSLSPLGSPTLPRHLINSREIMEAPGLWRSDLNMEMLHYCRSFGRKRLERKWKDYLSGPPVLHISVGFRKLPYNICIAIQKLFYIIGLRLKLRKVWESETVVQLHV